MTLIRQTTEYQSMLRTIARRFGLGPKYVKVRDSCIRALRRITYRGDQVQCACCGTSASSYLRQDLGDTCAFCASRPRQRFIALYLQQHLPAGATILHFAPELCLQRFLRARPQVSYLSADLCSIHADVHVDLADAPTTLAKLGTQKYSILIASHILEHLPDDLGAMRLFTQLLRPDGLALFQVPLNPAAETYEDWSITTPEGRLQAFGQEDHVRVYGPDIVNRLTASGFHVETIDPTQAYSPDEQRKLGLGKDITYLCRVAQA